MKATYKMPDLVDVLNNTHITERDRSAIRWAIVTIQTLKHDLKLCEDARQGCDCDVATTSEARS